MGQQEGMNDRVVEEVGLHCTVWKSAQSCLKIDDRNRRSSQSRLIESASYQKKNNTLGWV